MSVSKTKQGAAGGSVGDLESALNQTSAAISEAKVGVYDGVEGASERLEALERERTNILARLDVAREREDAARAEELARRRAEKGAEFESLRRVVSLKAQGEYADEIAKRVEPLYRDLMSIVREIETRCDEARPKAHRLASLGVELGLETGTIGNWQIRTVIRHVQRAIATIHRDRNLPWGLAQAASDLVSGGGPNQPHDSHEAHEGLRLVPAGEANAGE